MGRQRQDAQPIATADDQFMLHLSPNAVSGGEPPIYPSTQVQLQDLSQQPRGITQIKRRKISTEEKLRLTTYTLGFAAVIAFLAVGLIGFGAVVLRSSSGFPLTVGETLQSASLGAMFSSVLAVALHINKPDVIKRLASLKPVELVPIAYMGVIAMAAFGTLLRGLVAAGEPGYMAAAAAIGTVLLPVIIAAGLAMVAGVYYLATGKMPSLPRPSAEVDFADPQHNLIPGLRGTPEPDANAEAEQRPTTLFQRPTTLFQYGRDQGRATAAPVTPAVNGVPTARLSTRLQG